MIIQILILSAFIGVGTAQGNSSNYTDTAICKGGSGTFLPAFNAVGEADWPSPLKIVLYLIGLLWTFAGVGVITDVFMEAIEVITSKEKIVMVDGKQVVLKVWNPTIANLSLMALGSSAPEIILSVIEITFGGFFAGKLGPSTIVGSAAFNLLVIFAVCLFSIPKGETRRIESLGVFVVTAIFSVLAYVWLPVILVASSPDVIELWEALVTLFLFPVLLVLSWLADKGKFDCRKDRRVSQEAQVVDVQVDGKQAHFTPYETAAMLKGLPKDIDPSEAANILASEQMSYEPPSRAMFRINAVRQMTGSSALLPDPERASTEVKVARDSFYAKNRINLKGINTIGFESIAYCVPEAAGYVHLSVTRTGNLSQPATVKYRTQDITAKGGEDYIAEDGNLVFDANQDRSVISIQIIDDDIEEDDEHFLVVLTETSNDYSVIPERSIAHITILDDDSAGSVQFELPEMRVPESIGTCRVKVKRAGGSGGVVKLKYYTKDGDAHSPLDYEATAGTLIFETGEVEKLIDIPIKDDEEYEKDEHFFLVIEDSEGAELGSPNQIKIIIENDDIKSSLAEKVTALLNINRDKFRLGGSDWSQQFKDALAWPEESVFAAIMHVVTLPWKLLGACIPPTVFANGWVTFVVALIFVGLVTALIGDLAAMMGCAMGLDDAITAITFVALGTSLPDTFASRSAAVASRTADAAITNVTGSNSVNVFLGLGLSWSIAAIYWTATGATPEWKARAPRAVQDAFPNGVFFVEAGGLAFSVIVFTMCCLICLASLMFRRSFSGAELGGPGSTAFGLFFIFLWLLYVILSSLNVEGIIPNL